MIGFRRMNKLNINKQIALKISHLSKRYEIYNEKPTFVEKITNGANETFWALRNINLTIKKGEKVGIVGPNGCGKTTLLKLIVGITTPTTGSVKTCGKVVSLIDIEAGFHPDLSGIDNILLNGMILGMNNNEIKEKLGKIVEFADIGKFIDAQMFTYSEGMKLRLGFSVAINADPDILVLDENISVGDQHFQQKSFAKIRDLYNNNKTVIATSHNLDFIGKSCSRVISIKNGHIHDDGPTSRVIPRYLKENMI
jgi:ABC-type polysaccharide/polyol phosphate transport system ATPase subunit